MSERIDTLDEDQEFIAPDNGGWHYTIMRDWIAVCPDISPTAARLYWIIRSIMHEKGERARRLSYDQLCYLLPGVNGKPTGETRVKDALRELETVGLLSNPDGDVVRRWITDPKTGKQRKDNFRRWKVHDYPTHDYAGWRSAIAKLDAYTEDWRERLSTEGRNSASQASGKAVTSNNNPSSQRSTEGRNSASSRRNSDPPRRNSGDDKPVPSNNDTAKNLSKESSQPTKDARPVDNSEVVGWLGATPTHNDHTEPLGSVQDQHHGTVATSTTESGEPETEGRSLLRTWGVIGRPLDTWAATVDEALDLVGRAEARRILTDGLNDVRSPAGVIVGRRLPALRERLSEASRPTSTSDPTPQRTWCGECLPVKSKSTGRATCSQGCSNRSEQSDTPAEEPLAEVPSQR